MARKPLQGWEQVKAIALSLDLPHVEETTTWGQPGLKAHGKLWVWWSPSADAPVFKVPFEERAFLVEADPETFFFTPHYRNHPLLLVRPHRLDTEWAKRNLRRVWRGQAPKRVLKAFDAAQAAPSPPAPDRTAPRKTKKQTRVGAKSGRAPSKR